MSAKYHKTYKQKNPKKNLQLKTNKQQHLQKHKTNFKNNIKKEQEKNLTTKYYKKKKYNKQNVFYTHNIYSPATGGHASVNDT